MNTEKVYVKQATKSGYIECEIGGVADFSYPSSRSRMGRVQGGGNICPTITSESMGICRIERDLGGVMVRRKILRLLPERRQKGA